MKTVRIGVMPYVYKYIYHTYGPGDRFDLTCSRKSDLYVSFENLGLTAQVIPQPERLPGRWLHLKIGDVPGLLNSYESNRPWFNAGAFFQHEFNLHLRQYIEAQRDIAVRMQLKENEWNARIGLETFLDRYEIQEHEYSYESLRRQWTRQNSAESSFLFQTLSRKLGFRHTDNQYFSPCRLSIGDRKMIEFYTYSRAHDDIVRKQIRIPSQLVQEEKWIDWAYDATQIINTLLRKGCSIE